MPGVEPGTACAEGVVTRLCPPRIHRDPFLAALERLGLTWDDVAQMRADLHAAMARNSQELIARFR